MLGDGWHGRGGEVAPPHALLICVIVSITYQEELLSPPWLPWLRPFSADRLR